MDWKTRRPASSPEFESATNTILNLWQKLDLYMSTCQRCGRCFKGATTLEELKMKRYRSDALQSERWIYRAHATLESDPAVNDIQSELD